MTQLESAYARTQPDPITLRQVRDLLTRLAGEPEAERIRGLLNQARTGGMLSAEVVADAEQRLARIVPQVVHAGMTQAEAVATVKAKFETVPNGWGGVTTRKVETPAPVVKPTAKAAIVRWVAEGYLDTPNDEAHPDGRCRRCAGTGDFITGSVNGKPTGPGGICYRCNGKGRQVDCGPDQHRAIAAQVEAGQRDTSACCDRMRNGLYDTYGVRIHW